MSDEEREAQIGELEALESVLRENKLTKTSDWTAIGTEIEGCVEVGFDSLSDPTVLVEGTFDSGEQFSFPLDILPPVRLKFRLPVDYPSVSSPHLEVESDWMSLEQKNSTESELASICSENQMMPVLFFCYQAIIDRWDQMTEKKINLNEAYVLKQSGKSIDSLKKELLGKGEEAVTEHFVNTLFDCEVCYESLVGSRCVRFQPCSHVFCKSCIHDYYRSVANGIMSRAMQCLAGGCRSEAPQSLVKEALGEELFAKYESVMLEKAIRDMDDTVECPREHCQKVAYVTDRTRNLAECSYCQFSFCNLCKQTFHGIAGCKWKKDERMQIVKKWQEGSEEERADLCRQFGGEKHVAALVERFLNEEWLQENSKPCPKCAVSIEKNDGCHKMHCTKCDTYFCWLCSQALSKEDPYGHFQGDGTCSGRLFEGIAVDDDPLEDVGFDFDDAFDDGSDYESDDSQDESDDSQDDIDFDEDPYDMIV